MTALRIYFLLGVLLSSVSFAHSAGQECCSPRHIYYGDVVVDGISSKGVLRLDNTTVRGAVSSSGAMQAYCAEMLCAGVNGCTVLINTTIQGELWVKGKTLLRNSVVGGTAEIRGILEASHTLFCDRIQTNADIVDFSRVCAHCIFLFPAESSCGEMQVVKLTNSTVVEGDIVFQSGRGCVLIDRSSVVYGQVHGGIIRFL